jgi:hypothetical protein
MQLSLRFRWRRNSTPIPGRAARPLYPSEHNRRHERTSARAVLVDRGDVWWLDEDNDTSGFAPDEASAPAGVESNEKLLHTR